MLHGARIAMRAVGAPRAIVGVEDNKPDAVEALRKAAGAATDITVAVIPTKYPQGAEKMLIKVLLGPRGSVGRPAVAMSASRCSTWRRSRRSANCCRAIRG